MIATMVVIHKIRESGMEKKLQITSCPSLLHPVVLRVTSCLSCVFLVAPEFVEKQDISRQVGQSRLIITLPYQMSMKAGIPYFQQTHVQHYSMMQQSSASSDRDISGVHIYIYIYIHIYIYICILYHIIYILRTRALGQYDIFHSIIITCQYIHCYILHHII